LAAALGRDSGDLLWRADRGPHATTHHGERLMLVEIILIFFIVLAGTGGELCLTRAMKTIGEVHDFRPRALLNVFARALRVGWMWIALLLMTTGFFALLGMLSIENVSF